MTAGALPARVRNLDALRGFVVLLAFIQHYAGFLNQWYVRFFREGPQLAAFYQVHIDHVGRILPFDQGVKALALVFVPWVTQLYIFLAAFNLGRRDRQGFQTVYSAKLKVFLVLFLAFTVENMLVSQNFGQMLSLFPLQTWMLLLALMATAFRFGGWQAVAVLFVLSWLRFILPLPEWNMAIDLAGRTGLHPGFSYDAPLDRFLTSGLFGFLIGQAYFRAKNTERLSCVLMAVGAVAAGLYLALAPPYTVDVMNIYATEHTVSDFPLGLVGILGIELFLVAAFLELERRGFVLGIKPLIWIGVNSLAVFFFHKILFIYVLMPFREFFGAWAGVPLRNTLPEILVFEALAVLIVYLILRSGFFKMFAKGDG